MENILKTNIGIEYKFRFVREHKMLKIKDFTFQEDWGDRRSYLMFFKADQEESASWAVDIGFKPGDFEDSGSGI